MYQPSAEQAEKDRLAAYEAGVPHGKFKRCNRGSVQNGRLEYVVELPAFLTLHCLKHLNFD